ncbi:hypothetical protein AB0O26_08715, partial [Micrococcus luteus]|uniref:hypothetical protein n=1 Tax=Micrococcus luteus TaxID=1270 RepID=UPI0034340F29
KVRSKAPTVTASVSKMVVATGEGYTTIRDSTQAEALTAEVEHWVAGVAMPGQATIAPAGTNDVLTGTPLSQLR